MDWEFLAHHYESLLRQWQFKIQPKLKRSELVMQSRMIMLGIELDLKSYELKKGKNKALDEKKERYSILSSCIEEIASLEDENYNLSLIANAAIQERDAYKYRLKKLEEKLKAYEEFNS